MKGTWFAGVLLISPMLAVAGENNVRLTNEQQGRQLYELHCVACHGERTTGDGPLVASLTGPVPDLTSVLKTVDQEQLSKTVMRGKGLMPSFDASLKKEQARLIIKYMEGLVGKPPVADDLDDDAIIDDVSDGEAPAPDADPIGVQ